MRHSDKPRSVDNKVDELLDRIIRLETRLCILMNFFNVKYDARVAPEQHTEGKPHG